MFWEPILWNIDDVNIEFLDLEPVKFINSMVLFLMLLVGQSLVIIGLYGMIRRFLSLLLVLLCLELTLLGINFTTVIMGFLTNQPFCLILSLIFLVIAAVETALGLSLIFLYHKTFSSTSLKFLAKIRY